MKESDGDANFDFSSLNRERVCGEPAGHDLRKLLEILVYLLLRKEFLKIVFANIKPYNNALCMTNFLTQQTQPETRLVQSK